MTMMLKDRRVYCNNCGARHESRTLIHPCCESPQVGDNIDHTKAVIKQNRIIRDSRKNDYASNDAKTLRWGISMPRWMYLALDEYERKHERRLFNTDADITWFAKNFPQFSIPQKI